MERSTSYPVSEKEKRMKNIFKWVYLIGMLLAVIAALASFSAGWFTSLLILAAVLAGIFYFDPGDVVHQGIRYIVLVAVAGAVDKLLGVGPYLTGIFTAVAAYIAPAVLTVLVVYFVKKYFLAK
jgi:hypothetical protein